MRRCVEKKPDGPAHGQQRFSFTGKLERNKGQESEEKRGAHEERLKFSRGLKKASRKTRKKVAKVHTHEENFATWKTQ
jgi:hypothetical protein